MRRTNSRTGAANSGANVQFSTKFYGFKAGGLALLVAAAMACDGGSGPTVTDGGADSGTGGVGAIGGFGLTFGGGTGGTLVQSDGGVKPIPVPNPQAVKILPGRGRLVGGHVAACSNADPDPGQPAVGDRWCAFFEAGDQLGRFNLWAFNLTKVAIEAKTAPKPLTCATRPDVCKLLTANLWTGQPQGGGPSHPFAHGFDGDTLIFHADALSGPDELYKGPIYAWRPGWAEARRIGPSNAITCAGHPRAAVALCLSNIEDDETKPLEYDLLAGPLVDAAGSELPLIDRIHPLNANDITKWRSAFSRDGSLFGYSTGTTDTDAEVLRILKTADAKTFNKAAAPSIPDASRFVFSRDASATSPGGSNAVYYLSQFNYSDQGNPAGLLKAAKINAQGTFDAPTMIHDKVGAFLITGADKVDRGVAFFYDVAVSKGTLRMVANIANPAAYVTVQNNIASALLSGDPNSKYTLFSRDFDQDTATSDLYVAHNTTATKDTQATSCPLQRSLRTDLYGSPFLDSAGMVFYTDEVDTQLLIGTGVAADPDTCKLISRFAEKVDFWFPIGNEGLLYSDATDPPTGVSSIKYRVVGAGGKTFEGNATSLQVDSDRIYSFSSPDFGTLLYQIDSGSTEVDGIYLFDLPFPLGAPTPDGGTDAKVGDAGI